jgi:ribonuclease G
MAVTVLEQCPSCRGTGEIKSSIMLVDDIENNLNYLVQEQNEKSLSLSVHPYIAAYLTKGFNSIQMKWFMKYRQWVKVKPTKSFHLMKYQFYNKAGDEIKN